MKDLVKKIHATPYKAVVAITGGGTEAIGELLRHGDGSKTLIEAVVPYDQTAFDAFVRGRPDKYCSPGAARDLAMAAFQLGVNRIGNHENMIGVGCSASLVKDIEREGREHHAYIAIQTADETTSYTVVLHGHGLCREEEETITAEAIIKALAAACKVKQDEWDDPVEVLNVIGKFRPEGKAVSSPSLKDVVLGKEKVLTVIGSLDQPKNRIIFPGAFNPIHEQHIAMAGKVAEITGDKIDLELCIRNVDKPALNYLEIDARLTQFANDPIAGLIKPWINNVHLTCTPTFAEKSLCFPGAKFLIGWDTFKRISDPKYGNLDWVIKTFQETGIKFLVFHRIMNGRSSALEGTDGIRPEILEISTIFPENTLPPVEISSSEIRKRATH